MLRVLLIVCSLPFFAAPATAQEEGPPASKLAEHRTHFQEAETKWEKRAAAVSLWLEGDHSAEHRRYLLDNAWTAVLDDAPRVWKLDKEGELVRGEFSDEFLEWAREREVDPGVAARERLYEMPGDIRSVAFVGDAAAIEVLERGLYASNPVVVLTAAQCLADKEIESALPRLKEIARTAEPALAEMVALELLRYDDAEAREIATSVAGPKQVEVWREYIATDRRLHSQQETPPPD
jgi:hypothetical protein